MQRSKGGVEANFDGLVGPTHNYAGLSLGNVASIQHAQLCSNPKAAAQQGLAKMKALYDLGLLQGVLAPHERPDIYTLRQLGFTGTNEQILAKAYKNSPEILAACYSASSMWSANAATVSSSLETADKKVHFTPANLVNKFHRSIEVSTTAAILKAVFADSQYFHHHAPLPSHEYFGDEGAANHTRLAKNYDSAGIELYIFGKYAFNSTCQQPKKYPARQTYEASRAIVNLHGLKDDKVIYIQQHPDVIDQGVFHNDVIAVGNNNVLFYHQAAFYNSNKVIEEIKRKFQGDELYLIEVKPDEVSVQDCIATYLFNTQIITLAHGDMCIIAPEHCKENVQVKSYLDYLLTKNTPIKSVQYFDVNESMKNGGGPACLRLRVVLNKHEQQAVNQHCLLSDRLYFDLLQWIEKHYRDKLTVDDFRDVNLLHECRTALDELTQLLHLGSVYKFQQI